ncbi:CPBP family intramembrane glutamic endopeptidase [Parvimonas micra]|uniref:CPBP family intramembrane glutamic endopeptidase n=1 Tax=Parvimonas micra TaxID=33033 RepID=UPI002B470DA0|nr:CPBP family intramembrane glutamic endopeptidase [Parvimonas micra]MEB3060065.1 CPBP family intramembrane glutamic endopeptidase [Parvimonas micra]MEB3066811.1 CPBP family intramembrane glutamic endopeptidase [Parvimonas micra]
MGKTDLLNIKNFKKWILPILILISYKFIFDKMISYIVINRAGNFSKSILIGNFIVAIILFLLIKFIFKGKLNSIDSSEKMDLKKSIIISIVVLFLTIGIIYGVMWVQSFLFSHISLNSSNADAITKEFKSNPLPVVGLSFVTSTLEELVYRQLLFGYLYDLFLGCNKYIRYLSSALISAIIFGSIHDGLFHPAMLQYITHGFILSGLYLYTKRISSPIIVHVLFNLLLDFRRFIIYF